MKRSVITLCGLGVAVAVLLAAIATANPWNIAAGSAATAAWAWSYRQARR